MTRPRLQCLKPRLDPAKPRGWASDERRGSRHERGYGREWEKLRAEILKRDEGLCQPCLFKSMHVTPATEVDHVVPKAHGGTDHPSNLQAICGPCHRAKTAREHTNPGGEGRRENSRSE